MANFNRRFKLNVSGKFYVDDKCIACDNCVGIADKFFKMNDDLGHAYVYRQPSNKDEEKVCIEALESCPVDAIGKDGK
jgi:ferredoxin